MTNQCGRLAGKTALITGGASGMGKAAAELFAQEGAQVVCADLNDAGEKIAAQIRESGAEATFVRADISQTPDCEKIVQTAVQRYGSIDVFYGNAGISSHFNFHEMDIESHYDRVMNVNCRANFVLTKLILPYMLKQGKGSLIFTLSVNAEYGMANGASYSASKAALKQLIKSLALEYSALGIRANGILPGLIRSGMTVPGGPIEQAVLPFVPMGRAGEAREIAQAALFFASDDSSYCSGSMLVVDGGQSSGIRPQIEV
ncbi:MAG: SDR family oxidoreductase [Peptococcaceae bacterium]|jgi:NAD(P)-dependent dehydrogenase (short-subunit alcohol dehydrogenase family)|nr:SDR family oxidoreductase [Peptococcaceae bacterium]